MKALSKETNLTDLFPESTGRLYQKKPIYQTYFLNQLKWHPSFDVWQVVKTNSLTKKSSDNFYGNGNRGMAF